MEWFREEYSVSDKTEKVQRKVVNDYIINRSYWGKGRTCEQMNRAMNNSICFSLFKREEQIGFARVITDYALIFYLADVFVLEEHRGKGLGKWLIECVIDHPSIKGLLGLLNTRDAHTLYERFSFAVLSNPRSAMIRTAETVTR
ncbi:MAG TPA: GNAT family N-acetyltransferase [Mesotoga infera]|jgi:GNAT superfamily N-acetyltransferase|nr:GNAT family N-acetyltransferase [Mesotoga infera]